MKKPTAVEFLIDELFTKSEIEVTQENNPNLFSLLNKTKQLEEIREIEAKIEVLREILKDCEDDCVFTKINKLQEDLKGLNYGK